MDIEQILIKHFGKSLTEKHNGNISAMIEIIEDKINENRIELDYLTTMVNCSSVSAFDQDPEESCCCSDDSENAALIINLTTSRIKELESALIALRQLGTESHTPTTQVS